MPFNLGWVELSIILVIVVVIFGAGKLPEIGSSLGKSIRGFKSEIADPNKETEEKSGAATEAKPADLKAEARPAAPAPSASRDEAVR